MRRFVQPAVKPTSLLLMVLLTSLAASFPHAPTMSNSTSAGAGLDPARPAAQQAAANLTAWATEARAADRRDSASTASLAGNLWIEVSRLKRDGRNVGRLEWCVSDLENSLRRGSQDATARRHRLNNLDYELEALKRRLR